MWIVTRQVPRVPNLLPGASGSEPARPENPDPGGGAHNPMRDDAVDGEELTVQRVPSLPPETKWKTNRRTRVDGTCSAQKLVSSLRCVQGSNAQSPSNMASFGRDREKVVPILCVKWRNSSTGVLGATVVDKKGASDYASSFLTSFIKSLGFQRILVRCDNERSLLSLIERVTCKLTGVELVLLTSPEKIKQMVLQRSVFVKSWLKRGS